MRILCLLALTLTAFSTLPSAVAQEQAAVVTTAQHPRLIFKPDDVARIRHWCGVQRDQRESDATYGENRLDYRAVRAYFRTPLGDQALPGEILGAAFLHLIEPEDPEDARRMSWLERRLTYPDWNTMQPLELAIAADWCGPDLDDSTRRSLLLAAEAIETPLSDEVSPFSSRKFDQALFSLALAVAIGPEDEASRAWAGRRGRLLEAGTDYARTALPTLLACRTPTPTSPEAAASEETNIALLLEILSAATERDQWPRHTTTLRSWMEHYIVARPPDVDPALLFIRDDSNGAAIHPAAPLAGLHPTAAHLFAVRTRSAAAFTVANRVTKYLRNPEAGARAGVWRWVPAALHCVDCDAIDELRLPEARNLGGGVVLRGMLAGAETRIWIDAGPPRLRQGQHYDAGHFLIYRGGYQTVMASDDVSSASRETRGGARRLGNARSSFDIEQFEQAAIAHNCLVFEDPAYRPTHYGREFLPTNGQALPESSCLGGSATDSAHAQRIVAYSTQPGAAYVALDLTGAYDRELVRTYTREFFWLDDCILVIADRWRCPHGRVAPTAVIQLPAMPTSGGVPLGENSRGRGGDRPSGVWLLDNNAMVDWRSGSGATIARFIQPKGEELRVVGGPAERLNTDPDGHSGISYVGGGANTYERLIHPADRTQKLNAWFRIGTVTGLGPAVGVMPRWGRIEFETARGDEPQQLFTVLVVQDAGPVDLPEIASEHTEAGTILKIEHDERAVELRLPDGLRRGGEVTLLRTGLKWQVPDQVLGDPPFVTLEK